MIVLGIGALFVGILVLLGFLHPPKPPVPYWERLFVFENVVAVGIGVMLYGLAFLLMPLFVVRTVNLLYELTLHYFLLKPESTPDPQRSFPPLSFAFLETALLLKNVNRDIDYIFCATDLSMGTHFLMAPRFLLSSHLGNSSPGNLALATAVLASAAFPGVAHGAGSTQRILPLTNRRESA